MAVNPLFTVLATVWFLLWTIAGFYFFRKRQFRISLAPLKLHALCVTAILVALAPLYLLSLYTTPWEVNTDEVAMIWAYREALLDPIPNLFGLSVYWGFPNLLYLGFGHLIETLGGMNLLHARMAHALSGLGALVLVYALVNVLSASRLVAGAAMFLVGINHSFLIISRMAMRNNSAVITESLSLALLLKGWLEGCPFLTFLGGLAAGLAFFAYYPSRIAIVLWVTFLVGGSALQLVPWKKALRLGAVAIAGWSVLVVPHVVAMQFDSGRLASNWQFQRDATLLTDEGRATSMQRQHKENAHDAVVANIQEGLSAFNSLTYDRSGIYYNPGFGFLDPITGVLLWIGAAAAFVNRRRIQSRFGLFYFTSLWLLFAFVINKAPDYTRMAVLLPFIGWLAATGLLIVARFSAKVTTRRRCQRRVALCVFAGGLALIAATNLGFAYVYITKSASDQYHVQRQGVGETGRFIENRTDAGRIFYIVGDQQHKYYSWGEPAWWYTWGNGFVGKNQSLKVIPPTALTPELFRRDLLGRNLPGGAGSSGSSGGAGSAGSSGGAGSSASVVRSGSSANSGSAQRQVTVFITRELWSAKSASFGQELSNLRVYKLTKDGALLAIEKSPPN